MNQRIWEKESKKAYGLLTAILQEGAPAKEEIAYLADYLAANEDALDKTEKEFEQKLSRLVQNTDQEISIAAGDLLQLQQILLKILQKKHSFAYGQKESGEPYSLGERVVEALENRGVFIPLWNQLKGDLPIEIAYTESFHPAWLNDRSEIEGTKYVVDDGYRITSGNDLLEQLPEEVIDRMESWLQNDYQPGSDANLDLLLKAGF